MSSMLVVGAVVGAAPVAYANTSAPTTEALVQNALTVAPITEAVPDADVHVVVDAQDASAQLTAAGGASLSIEAMDEADSVVLPQADGVQVLTVLKEGERTAQFDFDLPEGQKLSILGGGLMIVGSDGAIVGSVAAPWAIDSNGTALPTHYELVGERLIQHVNTEGAVFPVVADPRVGYGWSIYIRWGRGEVRKCASMAPVVFVGALAGGMCSKYVPAKPLAVICGAAVAAVSGALLNTFRLAVNENKCVEIRMDYSGGLDGWRRYSNNCFG